MKTRLFVAITLPVAHRSPVQELQNQLTKLNLPVTWEKLEKIHLSLNYIGALDKEEIYPVKKALSQVALNTSCFNLDILHLETLYKRHEESLIYLSVGESEALQELQEKIALELNRLRHPQPRKFLPTITIGRLKRTDPIVTKQAIDKLTGIDISGRFEPITVDKITLYENMISQKGEYYQKTAEYMLRLDS